MALCVYDVVRVVVIVVVIVIMLVSRVEVSESLFGFVFSIESYHSY